MVTRPRTAGLSRNQTVSPLLSRVNGKIIAPASPKPTLYPHRSRASTDEPEEEPTQRASSSDDDSSISLPTLKTTGGQRTLKATALGIPPLSSDSSQDGVSDPSPAVPGRPKGPRSTNLTTVASVSGAGSRENLKPRVAAVFNPPPASSDNEASSDAADHVEPPRPVPSRDNANLLAGTDSEDELGARGDLRPTKLSAQISKLGACVTKQGVAATKQGVAATKQRVGARKPTSADDINDPLRKSSQTSGLSHPTSSGGSHFENHFGHTRKPKGKQTYRKAKPQPLRRMPRPKPPRDDKKKELEKHVVPDSPEKKKKTAFQKPDLLDSPPLKPSEATLKPGSDLDSDTESLGTPPPKAKRKRKGIHDKSPAGRDEKKVKPTFWIPDGSPDRIMDTESHDLLRPLSSSSLSDLDSDDEAKQELDAKAKASVCPWCGTEVDPEVLKEFAQGRRLNVRLQTKFCRAHKKQTAIDNYRQKSYPEIDWDELPDRIQQRQGFLLGIIEGRPSHFRDILAEDIKQGKGRTLLKQEENLNPGYYGPRGFNLMCDFLVAQFGPLLKERAVEDRVIAGRGSAAFIQAVLVAELAVELIREDMGLDEEEARAVYHESKDLGEYVHEDA